MSEVHNLASQLYEQYRDGPIDLRLVHGRWYVMLAVGNQMMIVDGSAADTPEDALRQTIQRWQDRSPERPFGWSYDD